MRCPEYLAAAFWQRDLVLRAGADINSGMSLGFSIAGLVRHGNYKALPSAARLEAVSSPAPLNSRPGWRR
jgi:hypothetical protein